MKFARLQIKSLGKSAEIWLKRSTKCVQKSITQVPMALDNERCTAQDDRLCQMFEMLIERLTNIELVQNSIVENEKQNHLHAPLGSRISGAIYGYPDMTIYKHYSSYGFDWSPYVIIRTPLWFDGVYFVNPDGRDRAICQILRSQVLGETEYDVIMSTIQTMSKEAIANSHDIPGVYVRDIAWPDDSNKFLKECLHDAYIEHYMMVRFIQHFVPFVKGFDADITHIVLDTKELKETLIRTDRAIQVDDIMNCISKLTRVLKELFPDHAHQFDFTSTDTWGVYSPSSPELAAAIALEAPKEHIKRLWMSLPWLAKRDIREEIRLSSEKNRIKENNVHWTSSDSPSMNKFFYNKNNLPQDITCINQGPSHD